MKPQMKLYHYWRSSCSWRVRWALELKGLKVESIPVNLLQNEQKAAGYALKNPMQAVPTLEVDGKPLSESLAILEWLEEKYPTPALLPSDPFSRAKVRELSLIIAAGTQPLGNLKVLQYVASDQGERAAFAKHWITNGLMAYEKKVRETAGTYSFGGNVTIADLCLIPQCYNAERFAVDLGQFPLIKGIYDRCLKTKACEKAAPHNQPGAAP